MAVVHGFKVEIDGAGGKEVDTAWESVSGGELIIELTETTVGADNFQTTSPGHNSVGEITLRGAVSDKRAALESWINETVAGKTSTRTVSITPVDEQGTPGPTYQFFDCILSAYRPPLLRRHPCDQSPPREEVRFIYRDWNILG